MKGYLVKYALTKGIEEVEIIEDECIMSEYKKIKGYGWSYFWIGKEVLKDKDKAIQMAENMRTKKIASLKKQIERLEKLNF